IGSCIGGMLAATMPDHLRGKAGGWVNAGNLIGNSFGGAVGVRLTRLHVAPPIIAITIAAMVIVPVLGGLFIIDRQRREMSPQERFGGMLRDVRRVISSRPGWTGILFCLSPVGTAALVNLFSAMSKDFGLPAEDSTVELINGWAGGLISAIGSLV